MSNVTTNLGMGFTHELGPDGKHRLIAPDGKTVGKTSNYTEPAILKLNDEFLYVAFTGFYEGYLPVGQVMSLQKLTIKTTSVDHSSSGWEDNG